MFNSFRCKISPKEMEAIAEAAGNAGYNIHPKGGCINTKDNKATLGIVRNFPISEHVTYVISLDDDIGPEYSSELDELRRIIRDPHKTTSY